MFPARPGSTAKIFTTRLILEWAEIWIVLLVFDLTILALTVAKALTMRESVHYGLFRVLFRDGELSLPWLR